MKTWKREVAVVFAIFIGFIAFKASEVDPIETLKIIIWPGALFIGAAFGMQWASKQTGLVGNKYGERE